jgi:hypothetical protein
MGEMRIENNRLIATHLPLKLATHVLYSCRVQMRGGAPVKLARVFLLVALIVFAASIVRADDTRVVFEGGGGGSPDCGSALYQVPGSGPSEGILPIGTDCHVFSTTGPVTTFSFEVADSNTTGGGLTCQSNLVTMDGWSGPSAPIHNANGIDTCTFTAPTTVTLQTYLNLLLNGDPYTGGPTISTFHNDGDCDLDDFVLGIPVGCDIDFNNPSTATNPNLFVGGALVGISSDGDTPPSLLPEPGTLALLLAGMTTLPFIRRKFAR